MLSCIALWNTGWFCTSCVIFGVSARPSLSSIWCLMTSKRNSFMRVSTCARGFLDAVWGSLMASPAVCCCRVAGRQSYPVQLSTIDEEKSVNGRHFTLLLNKNAMVNSCSLKLILCHTTTLRPPPPPHCSKLTSTSQLVVNCQAWAAALVWRAVVAMMLPCRVCLYDVLDWRVVTQTSNGLMSVSVQPAAACLPACIKLWTYPCSPPLSFTLLLLINSWSLPSPSLPAAV